MINNSGRDRHTSVHTTLPRLLAEYILWFVIYEQKGVKQAAEMVNNSGRDKNQVNKAALDRGHVVSAAIVLGLMADLNLKVIPLTNTIPRVMNFR